MKIRTGITIGNDYAKEWLKSFNILPSLSIHFDDDLNKVECMESSWLIFYIELTF